MNVEGVPFTLTYKRTNKTFTLTSQVKLQGGSSTGKLTLMDGIISEHDKYNYFVDQPGSSFTASQQGNGYVITSKVKNSESTMYGKTYKVVALGANQKAYAKLSTENWEQGDSTDYATWIIVTEQERKDAFKTVNNAHVAAVNATFLMSDFDFARNDNSCSKWKTGATATGTTTGTLSYSGNKVCKPTDAEGYTYYLGNGYDEGNYTTDPITGETMTVGENRQQSYGGAWTANIHGARGSVVQTIPAKNMIKEGWYRISCVGFTTTTKGIARLYAAAGMGNNTTGSGATAQSEKFAIANLHRIDDATRPATYVAASKLLDTPNVNTFDASVKVYVSPTGEAETPYETLSFGIDTQDADDNAWTCFDNFKIEYLGTPPNDLILDEDQTDGGYIKAQAQDDNKTLQKSIVYLHRTMNAGKWNSLVLPINLTVGQVKSIFGDQVHISKFYSA